ncbi:MAG: hypothetical protein JSW71_11060 [Gemmatimonadota bacterium]|nr:MAG: hypothetical protein JSW71_11060 [Gemmatimonadota bacterium]
MRRPTLLRQLLRLVALLLVGLGTSGGALTTVAAQGPEWHFNVHSVAPIELPSWLDRDSLAASLGYEYTPEVITGFLADLNQDGTEDYVFNTSLDACGTNCEYLPVDGASHQSLGWVGGSIVFVRLPLINGYPVIHSYSHVSADAARWSTSVFDGERYVFVGVVYLEGDLLDRHMDSLREIPYWPPPDGSMKPPNAVGAVD